MEDVVCGKEDLMEQESELELLTQQMEFSLAERLTEGSVTIAVAIEGVEAMRRAGLLGTLMGQAMEISLRSFMTPDVPGCCYLSAFEPDIWPLVFAELGFNPVLSDVTALAKAASLDVSNLRVGITSAGLHVIGDESDGGFRLADVQASLKQLVLGRTVGAPDTDARVVISVDVPDPDNFLMVAQALQDCVRSGEKPLVTLVRRPVDLSVVSYGSDYGPLLEMCSGSGRDKAVALLSPIGPLDRHQLHDHENFGFYFCEDRGFEDPGVCSDTDLYMRVSVTRLVHYLGEKGYTSRDYDLAISDGDNRTVRCGLRHAAHKPDYLYGLSAQRYALALRDVEAVEKVARQGGMAWSSDVRALRVQLCLKYLEDHGEQASFSLSDVALVKARCYVGGPLTHVAELLRQGVEITEVVAMAGVWNKDVNLLGKQFNLAADFISANFVLGKVPRLVFVPTDVVKGIGLEVGHQLIEGMPTVDRVLYRRWAGDGFTYLYDLVAYLVHCDLLGTGTVDKLVKFPGGSVVFGSGHAVSMYGIESVRAAIQCQEDYLSGDTLFGVRVAAGNWDCVVRQ